MRIAFTKMHGLGNDFVVLDGREQPLPALDRTSVTAIADRHTGIGCDQVIVLEPSDTADFRMRIFNADGGEVEACGNASRAVGLLHGKAARIETVGGLIETSPADSGVTVDMGVPRFDWQDIPLAYAIDTHFMPVAWEELVHPVALNIGNPHAVFFVDDCDAIDLARLGPMIETDPIFPQRVNVNAATVEGRNRVRLRVWERGAGLTLACGTGACATAVAVIRRGLADSPVTVDLPGGSLVVEWRDDDRIMMSGPAIESFRGSFDPADFGIGA
ncbi:MAG: diaminopimelate epimerase [Alphaproteobacteria bacterium]|nr:diaminopimelate epimerase [Alphaproteobacteria bacterium]